MSLKIKSIYNPKFFILLKNENTFYFLIKLYICYKYFDKTKILYLFYFNILSIVLREDYFTRNISCKIIFAQHYTKNIKIKQVQNFSFIKIFITNI